MLFHFKCRCSTETPLFRIKLNDVRLRGSEETVMDDAEEKLQERQGGSFWLIKNRLEFM